MLRHKSLILMLVRLRQGNLKFKPNLDYIGSSHLA